jgi:hypothetical protein
MYQSEKKKKPWIKKKKKASAEITQASGVRRSKGWAGKGEKKKKIGYLHR